MMQEMKAAYLLHKLALEDPRVMPGDLVLKLAFHHNARIMDAVFSPFSPDFPRVGELSVGSAADLVLCKLNYGCWSLVDAQSPVAHRR
jgi:cytosine/adenosine deaminase-related metal-dependent hydrolase